MPSVRDVHDSFLEITSEQQALLDGLRAEAAALRERANELLDPIWVATADYAGRLGSRQDLLTLAEAGEQGPMAKYDDAVRAKVRRMHTHAEATAALEERRAALAERADEATRKHRDAALAIDTDAEDWMEAAYALLRSGFARAGTPSAARLAQLDGIAADYRARGWLAKRIVPRLRTIRQAEKAYARTGRDLLDVAHRRVLATEQLASLERDMGTAQAALDDADRTLEQMRSEDFAAPGHAHLMDVARAALLNTAHTRMTLEALHTVAPEEFPAHLVLSGARSERLRQTADELETVARSATSLHDQLQQHMPKLRRGLSAGGSRSINVDLDPIRAASQAIKKGLQPRIDAARALQRVDAGLSGLEDLERRQSVATSLASTSATNDDTLWLMLMAGYILFVTDAAPECMALGGFNTMRIQVADLGAAAGAHIESLAGPDAQAAFGGDLADIGGLGVSHLPTALPDALTVIPDLSFQIPNIPHFSVPDLSVLSGSDLSGLGSYDSSSFSSSDSGLS